VVVPRSGVIRHWQVRAAKGELTLVVTRPRDGGSFQITTSNTEIAGGADVQGFDTDLAVERGDRVGVRVTPGSAVGVRDGATGATTERWLPPVTGLGRAADRGEGTGFDHELLLRLGLLPGGHPRSPATVTGSAAESRPGGRVLARHHVPFRGHASEIAFVRVGSTFALDQFIGGRRTARIEVPGMRPGAQIVRFAAAAWSRSQTGVDLHYVNVDSARVIQRSYVVTPTGFTLIR
jgi:hypothetical protein